MPGHGLGKYEQQIEHKITDPCPYCGDRFPTYTVLHKSNQKYYTCEKCSKQWVSDVRTCRLDNLKAITKIKQNKVQMPGFKKHDTPGRYAVLYSNRDSPKIYDILHIVEDSTYYNAMVKYEVYKQVVVYDLDNGQAICHNIKKCHCHPVK